MNPKRLARHEANRCPLEKAVRDALIATGLAFQEDGIAGVDTKHLDFKVGDVYIEIKQRYSPRVDDQLARADNIIVLQGAEAVAFFCKLLRNQ
jgi:hypothetical protein